MTIDELKDFQYYYVPSNSPYAKEFVKDKDTNNYTAKGDGLADVFYKISNGNVSYHYEKVIGSEAVADATSFHKVVALKDLVKEFYGNDQQKSQIDALVAKLKSNHQHNNIKIKKTQRNAESFFISQNEYVRNL
ncbi:hypothetical protein AKUA1401_02150 [Apilactobacillus kunkeei]|nr:hypothetical protein AKUA1401_02150 [Apilactobacillus kunkeei]